MRKKPCNYRNLYVYYRGFSAPSWEFSRNKVWRFALTFRIFGIAYAILAIHLERECCEFSSAHLTQTI